MQKMNGKIWTRQAKNERTTQKKTIFFNQQRFKMNQTKGGRNMYNTYEDFARDMLSRGFTWEEVEYYWRNPDEFDELCD